MSRFPTVTLRLGSREWSFDSGQATIGTHAECAVRLTAEDDLHLGVSPRHASLQFVGDRLEVVDLGSAQGTYLNGQRVGSYGLDPRVRTGDRVRIGVNTFTVEIGAGPVEHDPDPLDALVEPAEWEALVAGRVPFRRDGSQVQLGPIGWSARTLSRRVAAGIVDALVEAAQLLARGPRARIDLLAARHLPEGTTRVGDRLVIAHRHLGWVTSHQQGWVTTEVGQVPLDALPADARALDDALALLQRAAADTLHRPGGRCRFCGQQYEAIDLHDATTCHGCAERHLGVIH